MPKLSIIIPVYNVEEYIRECLDSIKNQTFTDFEVLMIDDGSPDGSGAICDEYAAKDSRFKVWHKENGGLSSARNVGLDNAQGEWITFLDSDDYLITNNAYEEILELASVGNYDLINTNFTRDKKYIPLTNPFIETLNKEALLKNFYKYHIVWTGVYKREKIGELRFANIKSEEDTLFMQSFLLKTNVKSALFTNKAYIYYRPNEYSLVNKYHPSKMQDILFIISHLQTKIETERLPIDDYVVKKHAASLFLLGIKDIARFKDATFVTKLIKEYAPKFNLSKIITWELIFEQKKPYISFLLLKLGLYNLTVQYLKNKI